MLYRLKEHLHNFLTNKYGQEGISNIDASFQELIKQ